MQHKSSMANFDDDSKSDGLEILSVGALYAGTWDKKYWSSSRGKDRYPYPVGYQAMRTHRGLTYKMEIHEGSKGPKFQITSNDNQFGSGETPDRACENFQKKCCSRIKLWHGKRSSGKIDGVEFFGFKNALVQRLLRELVATVNDACDQSLEVINCNEASSEIHDAGEFRTHEFPDLRSYLEKTTVTGKRRRTCRAADTKSAFKSGYRRCQPTHQSDPTVLHPTPGKTDADKPLISCALSDHDEEALPVLSNKEPEADVSSSAQGLSIMSDGVLAGHKEDPCLIQDFQVQNENLCMENCASVSSLVIDLPQEVKSFDRQSREIQGVGLPVATEGDQKVQVSLGLLEPGVPVQEKNFKVNLCDELCAPDSLDPLQEITSGQNCGSHGGEAAIKRNESAADMVCSEESDFDSIEDIAKSMMAVLLPRAVPLLKYTSRKRIKTKSPKDSCVPKLEMNPSGASISADVRSPADALEPSALDGQLKAPPSSVLINSGSSMMENIRLVVPDSLDKDQYEDCAVNEPPPPSSFGNVEAVAAKLQETREPDKGLNETSSSAHQNEATGFTETFSHEDLLKNGDRISPNDCVPVLQNAAPFLSSVVLDLVTTSEDQFLNADVYPKLLEISCKKTDLENLLDSKGMINNDFKGPELVPVSGAPQSLPGNTSPKIINTCQVSTFGDCNSSIASFAGGKDEEQISNLHEENVEGALAQNCDLHDQAASSSSNKNEVQFIDGCNSYARNDKCYADKDMSRTQHPDSVYQSPDQGKGCSLNNASHFREGEAKIDSNCLNKQEFNDEIESTMKRIGCYSHPKRISSVTLTRNSHEIYICVSCGLLEERQRDLFLYKLSIEEPCLGSPCMVGHTSMSLPAWKDEFGRDVAVDKTGLQITPDARSLVLADSIRVPYCREKNLHCLCPQCESCFFAENSVKIVQVKIGYVSLVLKLNTIFPVQCVLVCEPAHLIAVDESGRLYIWIMNTNWSLQTEVYVIASNDFLPSRVVELKKIPNSASMVVGHNGYGEFSLWDIIKRTVVSRFSAPASSVLDFLPVSLFSWPSKGLFYDKPELDRCVRKLEEANMLWFSRHSDGNMSGPLEGDDFAVWLLICSSSDSGVQSTCYSSNHHLDSDGCWRLGLLIKDTMILGAALQSSTTSIGSIPGTGIIGTHGGQVFVWDLATGSKVETLHDLKGKRVLHIATDDSTSSVVAIAGEDGQLCIYLHTSRFL